MGFFGQAERPAHAPSEHLGDEVTLLLFGAEIAQHQHLHEVADDRAFVLKVVVQAEALGRQMMADHRHGEVGAVLAAKFFRDGKAEMPGGIGKAAHLAQQFFPVVARQAVIVPIGAGMFAAMIEEPFIIVLRLQAA
jgi:hypothetical protein